MRNPKFKEGDVVCNKWGEYRVIYFVSDKVYFFVEYDDTGRWFYNPTKSAFSHYSVEKSFKKIGRVADLKQLQQHIIIICQAHNRAFDIAAKNLPKNKIIRD